MSRCVTYAPHSHSLPWAQGQCGNRATTHLVSAQYFFRSPGVQRVSFPSARSPTARFSTGGAPSLSWTRSSTVLGA
jgi:hypothetical protein